MTATAIRSVPSAVQQLRVIAAQIERGTAAREFERETNSAVVALFGTNVATTSVSRFAHILAATLQHGPCSTRQLREHIRIAGGAAVNPSTAKSAVSALERRGWIARTRDRQPEYLYAITASGKNALRVLRAAAHTNRKAAGEL